MPAPCTAHFSTLNKAARYSKDPDDEQTAAISILKSWYLLQEGTFHTEVRYEVFISETGFCPRHQAEPTQLCFVDRASLFPD
jgi:hypothetical protein